MWWGDFAEEVAGPRDTDLGKSVPVERARLEMVRNGGGGSPALQIAAADGFTFLRGEVRGAMFFRGAKVMRW